MGSLRIRLSSRPLSTAIKSANLLVFRSTSLACLVIILVHLTVVYLLSDHLGRTPAGRRQQRYFPGASDADEAGIVAIEQPGAVGGESSGKGMDGDGGRMGVWRDRELDDASAGRRSINASTDRFFSQSACRRGHIQGFDGFCDPVSACLRQLRGGGGGPGSSGASDALRPDSLPASTRRKIQSMTGNLDPVHYSIVPLLVDLQWTSGIYGSVGEIGVNTGKFTVVLAHNVDPEAGEGFFVSDNFDVPPPLNGLPAGLTKYQVFSVYMRETGFGEDFSGLRKLHVHRGDPTGLSKQLMHDWNLPQFRMISIDGAMGSGTLTALEWAACVLRDGGILIVDGVDEEKTRSQVRSVLGQFFRKHGYSAFGPFLAAANKLYMCTTNWKHQYIERVVEKGSYMSLRHMNDDVWGSTLTYIRIT